MINETSTNKIFNMAESTIINLKKADLTEKIWNLKGKGIADKDMHNLSKYILKPTGTVT